MRAIEAGWKRLGEVHAFAAGVALWGGAVGVRLILGETNTAAWIGVGLFMLFIVYCVARPHSRSDVFWTGIAPGPISSLADALLGWNPLIVGAVLIPFVLALLWSFENDRDAQPA